MAFHYGYGMEVALQVPRPVFIMRDGSIKDPTVSRSHVVRKSELLQEVTLHSGDNWFDTPIGSVSVYVNHLGEVYDTFYPAKKGKHERS
jgi:hypothetical protein